MSSSQKKLFLNWVKVNASIMLRIIKYVAVETHVIGCNCTANPKAKPKLVLKQTNLERNWTFKRITTNQILFM